MFVIYVVNNDHIWAIFVNLDPARGRIQPDPVNLEPASGAQLLFHAQAVGVVMNSPSEIGALLRACTQMSASVGDTSPISGPATSGPVGAEFQP